MREVETVRMFRMTTMALLIITVTVWIVKIMEDVRVIMLIITVTICVIKIMEDVTLKLIIYKCKGLDGEDYGGSRM